MHLPAERNGGNNKEEYEESHSSFLNELGLGPTGSAAHQSGCGFRPPEKDFCSEDKHSRDSLLRPANSRTFTHAGFLEFQTARLKPGFEWAPAEI